MSKFVPRWSQWNALESAGPEVEMANQQTRKTCKSPSAGFAGSLDGHSELSAYQRDHPRSKPATPDRPRHGLVMERIEAMDLTTFAGASLILQVHSRRLRVDVLFVSDNVAESALAGEELVVYRASELRKLAVLQPEPHTLRCLHEVKFIFNGVITDVRARDDHDQD